MLFGRRPNPLTFRKAIASYIYINQNCKYSMSSSLTSLRCEAATTYRSAISVHDAESPSPKAKHNDLDQGGGGRNRGRGKIEGGGGRGSRRRASKCEAGMKRLRKDGGITKKPMVDTQVKRPVLDVLCIPPIITSNELHMGLEALAIDTPSTTAPIQRRLPN